MILKRLSITLLILLSSLYSCSSIKPKGATKTGKKLFETFYLGEKGTQYFIKPIKFIDTNEELLMDFTVRENSETAYINYSIVENTQTKDISTVEITASNAKATLVNHKKLYSERKKEFIVSRFSSEVSKKELKAIFSSQNWSISINGLRSFKPTKRSEKVISNMNAHIFQLLAK